MRKLLVTGGAGFIGANFVHFWLQQNPNDRVIVLDSLTYAGNLANLESVAQLQNYRFIQGDITDGKLLNFIFNEENIDTVVHFAAESHVDRSISGPDIFIQTNIIGTHELLKAAKAAWKKNNYAEQLYRFHHVSTDEVYGSLNIIDPAFTETTPYAPNSPYSASKAASDHLVRAYHHTYGLPVTMSNCSNNYGPYQFPEKLIPLFITNALQGKLLPIYGDGQNIRDWLYVEDHCRGIQLILEKGKIGEVYNIGGNNEQTNMTLVELLCQAIDELFVDNMDLKNTFPKCPAARGKATSDLITFVKDRPGHDQRYAINAQKITEKLGYYPCESFATGIKKTLQWYLNHETWWQEIFESHISLKLDRVLLS
jgi:dTDP-glucose 4,6-dehydratase